VNQLKGQTVLVVGGRSGIGRATAAAFRDAGGSITIASRDAERLAAAACELKVDGRVLDATNDADVEAFFAHGGAWDHVVVSVAPAKSGSIRAMALADAYAAMDAKFWSAYRVARAARIAPEGSLTLVSGQVGKRPNPNAVLQGAINAGLEGLARGLALELAPVRVNAVSPGLIDTPLHAKMPGEVRDSLFKATAGRLPVGRIGTAEDVAHSVVYVATNGFSTGAVVRVDGGSTIA
jgi:NAD(P)-dependent dehydrogenase (short-subunit alcohol dehydrogenase family)